jgi:hypothetical protein
MVTLISAYIVTSRIKEVILGGVMVIVIAIGPGVAGSNPAERDGALRAIKFRSRTSIEGEAKSSAPCRKVVLHIKDPCGVL